MNYVLIGVIISGLRLLVEIVKIFMKKSRG